MHDLTLKQGPPRCRATLRPDRQIFDKLRKVVREAVSCYTLVHAIPLAGDSALIGLAQAGGGFDQGIQYFLEIKRRAADGLKNVGGGGLLLKCFDAVVSR